MTGNRFSTGLTTAITPSQKIVTPYDATLRFNRIIDQKGDDPATIIQSIDAKAVLDALNVDNPDVDGLEYIHKLTLAAKSTLDGVGLWDVMFNGMARQAMTACLFTLQNDFSPIPQNRVLYISKFLNYTMSVSRVHFNQVIPGDRLGICINDMSKGFVYVLFYVIDEICNVGISRTSKEGRPVLFPALNIRLEHALRVDQGGGVNIAEMEGGETYDHEKAQPFVEWMVDSVYDIGKAYPWKPHFLPIPIGGVDRPVLEARLKEEIASATSISYETFDELCRQYYADAKAQVSRNTTPSDTPNVRKRPSARKRDEQRNERPPSQPARLPVLQVISTGDDLIVKFDDISDPSNTSYRVPRDGGANTQTETFLLNKDLVGINIVESSRALVLSEDQFGENAIMRYLSVNY